MLYSCSQVALSHSPIIVSASQQAESRTSYVEVQTALAKAVTLTPSIVVAVSTIFQVFVCF